MDRFTAMWHTEGRRQPAVLGKDPAGKPIPGGPYTSYQVGAAALVGGLLFVTRPLWGSALGFDVIRELGAIVIAVWFVNRAAVKIDYTNVSLIWDLVGGIKCLSLHLSSEHPMVTTTGRAPRSVKPSSFESRCQVVSFVERATQADQHEPLQVPHEEAPTLVIEAPAAREVTDQTSAETRNPRRRPRTPKRVTDPHHEAPFPPAPETELPSHQHPPTSALENFLLAATSTTGAPR
ncbi:hypothetical protein [Luteococcus sp.]|uniref:hypothetical protein n=1 Tax=Luteococcus sp. TaxID=1969402 RepID=UPI0037366783